MNIIGQWMSMGWKNISMSIYLSPRYTCVPCVYIYIKSRLTGDKSAFVIFMIITSHKLCKRGFSFAPVFPPVMGTSERRLRDSSLFLDSIGNRWKTHRFWSSWWNFKEQTDPIFLFLSRRCENCVEQRSSSFNRGRNESNWPAEIDRMMRSSNPV